MAKFENILLTLKYLSQQTLDSTSYLMVQPLRTQITFYSGVSQSQQNIKDIK